MSMPTACRASIASVALGLSLALPLLHFLPSAFAEASQRRYFLALLLAGILICFLLEKCGVHRRFAPDVPAPRSPGGAGAPSVLAMPGACADAFLIGVVAQAQPTAGALLVMLRLAHDTRYWIAHAMAVLVVVAGTLVPRLDACWLRTVLVLASAKLLYVGVGELVPYLQGAARSRQLHQVILVAMSIAVCIVLPGLS